MMGAAGCRGCGTSGSGEKPLCSAVLLPPWSSLRQVGVLQEGKMQEGDGHWDCDLAIPPPYYRG